MQLSIVNKKNTDGLIKNIETQVGKWQNNWLNNKDGHSLHTHKPIQMSIVKQLQLREVE